MLIVPDDRKYRHRGYMDTGRDSEPRRHSVDEPRQPSTPGAPKGRSAGIDKSLAVVCKQCGQSVRDAGEIAADTVCSRCGQPLHSCRQCTFFDSSARWECSRNESIPQRVAVKTAGNVCPVYSPLASFDLTGSKASDSPSDARKAFEALFKK